MNQPTTDERRAFDITHVLDAPRDLVWRIWTEPEHAKHWWGPQGFTTPVYEADLRPGGKLVRHMMDADGTMYPSEGTFEEVVPPERLVTSGSIAFDGEKAFDIRTTVTFEGSGDRTIVRIHQEYWNVSPAAGDAIGGATANWPKTFAKLEAYLAQRLQAEEKR